MSIALAILSAALAIAVAVLLVQRRRLRSAMLEIALDIETGRGSGMDADRLRRVDPSLANLTQLVDKLLSQSSDLRDRARSRSHLFRTVLDQFEDGFLIVDHDLRISFANSRVADLFPGLPVSKGQDLIAATGRHQLIEATRGAISEVTSQGITLEVELPDGRRATYAVRIGPIAGAAAAAGGGAWIAISDITGALEIEQVRKDFVANASHELRTPLTLINGYVETLLDGGVEDPKLVGRSLEIMKRHGGRIERIIEDMLTISKLEGSGPDLDPAAFHLGECVEEVGEMLAEHLGEDGSTLNFESSLTPPEIVGDRFYWIQILLNLIDNAVKENSPRRVKVTVSLDRADGEDGGWVIRVSDDGIGIPATHVPFVFKRFYRVDMNHSNAIKGTGLGLSIVKRAVEAHGGEISLRSVPGQITEFTITVPDPSPEIAP